ncbi:MAG: hypothetical protein PHF37_00535 [Phycisphaerae bacterium]|nr:hypothetical protein [Phycisphaerae bacterium]
MKISLTPGDWTKLRQILQRLFATKFSVPDMKRGTSQQNADAAKNELWIDTSDNFRVKAGE